MSSPVSSPAHDHTFPRQLADTALLDLGLEADDLDAGIELAARIPAARMGGAIEVRPILEW
jgi:hypothetical protein